MDRGFYILVGFIFICYAFFASSTNSASDCVKVCGDNKVDSCGTFTLKCK